MGLRDDLIIMELHQLDGTLRGHMMGTAPHAYNDLGQMILLPKPKKKDEK